MSNIKFSSASDGNTKHDSQSVSLSTKSREGIFKKKHIAYFKRVLQVLPVKQLDTQRVSIAFFGIAGLDVLNAIEELENDKDNIISWLYSMQIHPNEEESNLQQCGFRGCSVLGNSYDCNEAKHQGILTDSSNIAMTYTALVSLIILGDDLSRVNKKAVLAGIRGLQNDDDGSFVSVIEGTEYDMRFMYCACCVCYMLDDWSGMDVEKATAYIMESLSFEGGFGQRPFNEAHGGSTFCAVASLFLMGRLETVLTPQQLSALIRWLLRRQVTGFTGRPNKPADTCYSFWVGAALHILGVLDLVDVTANRAFILSAQSSLTGGISKYPDHHPDPLHTHLGLCGLSLIGEPELNPIAPALNMSQRAMDHLNNLHIAWRNGC